MAKFYGKVGYGITEETVPGVWEQHITEVYYYGDVVRNTMRWQSTSNLNDDLSITNQLSIIADPYAMNNIHNMRYVEWMGTLWKITNVDVEYPRLILTMGGVYNGEQA